MTLPHPATSAFLGIPGPILGLLIAGSGSVLFLYIMARRLKMFAAGRADPRLDRPVERLRQTLVYAIGQRRLPRYPYAGLLHIGIFAGFMLLSVHTAGVMLASFTAVDLVPRLLWPVRDAYRVVVDLVSLLVLAAVTASIVRRAVVRPRRYELPEAIAHSKEPYVILALIGLLMVTDLVGEGTILAADPATAGFRFSHPGASIARALVSAVPAAHWGTVLLASFWLHLVILFGFMCFLPLGKHFHVILAIPNVFLGRLRRGNIKPVDHSEPDLEKVQKIGARDILDFTWKHLMDFASCTECGRCTDHCPANRSGSDLSPKLISVLGRIEACAAVPIFPPATPPPAARQFAGGVISESAIWACTTCGSCEEECPVLIEYVDKIVDMRRGLLEQGKIPASLQQPLTEIMKKGNPYGESKRKRADWASGLSSVKPVEAGQPTDLLFFADSCVSFDPRLGKVGRAFGELLGAAGCSAGILGKNESDSGNEVRRVGEEGLFQVLSTNNTQAIAGCGARRIVTTDPHAFNTLRNDYGPGLPPVEHSCQVVASLVRQGRISFAAAPGDDRVHTIHDACYLGRHNGIYDEPREIISRMPGLRLVEMARSRDRSFCCGGGGLMLWYERDAGQMKVSELRLRMAMEAGAQVIVTLCPYCCVNLEDAVKTTGQEGRVEVVDLMELAAARLVKPPAAPSPEPAAGTGSGAV